jgi:anti-anti-sigma factor
MTRSNEYDAGSSQVIAVVVLTGELDFAASSEHYRRITEAAATPDLDRLVIDVGGVQFIDSAGLALISYALKLTRERRVDLILRNPKSQTRTAVRVGGLEDFIFLDPPMPPELD